MDNNLFLYGRQFRGEPIISIGIGQAKHMRRVFITPEQALEIAYKLMSVAKGGETTGMIQMTGNL